MPDSKRKIRRKYVLSSIIIVFILFSCFYQIKNSYYYSSENYRPINTSNGHERIFIDGDATGVGAHNWTYALQQNWCTGSGTWVEPYIIENKRIDGQEIGNCIEIRDSIAYFQIKNCTLYNSSVTTSGIQLTYVDNGIILSNNCSFNNGNGIDIFMCDNNTAINNTVSNNTLSGINLTTFSHDNNITGNLVKNNLKDGIKIGKELFSSCNDNILSNNSVISNDGNGISICSDYNDLLNNSVLYNKLNGIFLNQSRYGNIWKNNCSYNYDYGILIDRGDYNNISGNEISYNYKGIDISGLWFWEECLDNEISNNNIHNNRGGGIEQDYCKNTIISNNNFTNNKLYVGYNNNNTKIYENTFENSGIYSHDSNYSVIYDNKINASDDYCININRAYYSNITGNTIYNGGIYYGGIRIDECNSSILSNNTLDLNTKNGIYVYLSNHTTLTQNKMYNCSIKFEDSFESASTSNIDASNTINDNPVYFYYNKSNLKPINFTAAGQVIAIYCNDSILSNFNISSILRGISMHFCKNISISEVNINDNDYGIYLSQCINITMNNINLSDNKYGIYLLNSNNTVISTITSLFNEYGIICYKSHNITINECNINYSEYGIRSWECNNINLTGNTIVNCDYGIYTILNRNVTLCSNRLFNCGVILSDLLSNFLTYKINTSNKVNNKPLYFYTNKLGLKPLNFTNAGQIILVNCNNSRISDIKMSNCTRGVSLLYCKNISIYNVTSINNTERGFYLGGGFNNTVQKCNFSYNLIGLYLGNTDNNTILETNTSHNTQVGIYISGSRNCTLIGNSPSNEQVGIKLDNSYDCNLTDNNMKNCGIEIKESTDWETYSTNSIDTTNKVNGKDVYYYFNKTNLNSNDFINAGQVILVKCNDSLINNLNITNISNGIYMYYCNNHTISNCQITNNNYGIYLYFGNNFLLTGNNINRNFVGLALISNNSTITQCDFIENNYSISGEGSNNLIYNNYIEGSAYLWPSNNWNNSYAGNYWSDYSGVDSDNDGIGDTPYLIYVTGAPEVYYDYKPLMYPPNIDTDGDGLLNSEEYDLGNDGYLTNVTNPDSDYDGLSDYDEWINLANPWDPDTDNDSMPDGWEVLNSLNVIDGNDNITDADNDGISNLNEFIYGTNPQMADTDLDGMPDGWEFDNSLNLFANDAMEDPDLDTILNYYEYLNGTDPRNNDTEFDGMPDGWEINNSLDPLNNDAMSDADNDQLENIYEFLNGTDPHNDDSDGDTILDGIEVGLHTDPLDGFWFPMPNLKISSFSVSDVNEGQAFILNFTITNNGIWKANGIILSIRCEALNLTLYENMAEPFDLEVNKSKNFLIDCTSISTAGIFVLTLDLDPGNLLNETYSSPDGSYRSDWAEDNIKQIEMQIIKGDGGIAVEMFIIVVSVAGVIVGIIGLTILVRPKIKKIINSKNQRNKAKAELEDFEFKVRNFIREQLEKFYGAEWWEKGIPEYIRLGVENKIRTEQIKAPKMKVQNMNYLDFNHYFLIINEKENWDNIFSNVFQDKNKLAENFENLRVFMNNISQNVATSQEMDAYLLYIFSITTFFAKGFNVFLSYSTLDSEYFQISELVSRLETYPKMDKIFFWEADSGENIVEYMERILNISKVFVMFCSENCLKSKAVTDEWQAAFQLRKKGLMKIVPVYEDEQFIPKLLMPLLNVKFSKDDFDGFIDKLYEEILR